MEAKFRLYCCNPLNKRNHLKSKCLRNVTKWMINLKLVHAIKPGYKVCTACRLQLYKRKNENCANVSEHIPLNPEQVSDDTNESSISANEDDGGSSSTDGKSSVLENNVSDLGCNLLNTTLEAVGASPIKRKRFNEKQYPKKKFQKVSDTLKSKIFHLSSSETDNETDNIDLLEELKEKFKTCTTKTRQLQFLTILPNSWSLSKIETEFGVTRHMARKAKELVREYGVLSSPNPKPRRTISKEALNKVEEFFNSDEVSRSMPGKKDFVTIRENEQKIQKQKRLLLSNLNEAYQLFKSTNPDKVIGFSKFCEVRPRNIILAGASGTHNVCVCTYHQNVKLMVLGSRLKDITYQSSIEISNYNHCLAQIICNPPLPNCFFGNCNFCPGEQNLKDFLRGKFEEQLIEEITYKQWLTTDRCNLDTITHSTEDFLDILMQKLNSLLSHSFIAKQQSLFQTELKSLLKRNEYLVICDFAENYAFLIQDQAQAYHWNNPQATIHPFVVYFKDEENFLQHVSFVVISDCLIHDTIAVYSFQKLLIRFLKEQFDENPKHIFYFSDGAAAQYKNKKNFINLCYHYEDFNISAEWHFFATSHGKSACDGLSGTIKRLATIASLQRPYKDQILCPFQLYTWCSENIKNCKFSFTSKNEYNEEKLNLQERFNRARTIPGTQKFHGVYVADQSTLKCKNYSYSKFYKLCKIAL